jgi:hypothetical protein
MKMSYNKLFLALISVLLLFFTFKSIHYLVKNSYIVECFESFIRESSLTSHTVSLPLTTTYSCKNFCGPTARCAISGQQCLADIDCPGCQPNIPPESSNRLDNPVPGNNDAGKLTWGVTPQYSTLTTDIGTQAKIINRNKLEQSPKANFVINVWRYSADQGQKLFDQRYKPSGLQYMPNYPTRYSLTGDFIEDGPLASNAYLG